MHFKIIYMLWVRINGNICISTFTLRHYSDVSELNAKTISNGINNGKRIQVLIVKLWRSEFMEFLSLKIVQSSVEKYIMFHLLQECIKTKYTDDKWIVTNFVKVVRLLHILNFLELHYPYCLFDLSTNHWH